MKSYETETGHMVDVQPNVTHADGEPGVPRIERVFLVIDGQGYTLTRADAVRISAMLADAAVKTGAMP